MAFRRSPLLRDTVVMLSYSCHTRVILVVLSADGAVPEARGGADCGRRELANRQGKTPIGAFRALLIVFRTKHKAQPQSLYAQLR